MFGRGFNIGAAIAALIGVVIFVQIATATLSPMLTSITDAAGLAILGSVPGGSATVLLLATVVVFGMVAWIVEMFFPGTAGRIAGRIRRR